MLGHRIFAAIPPGDDPTKYRPLHVDGRCFYEAKESGPIRRSSLSIRTPLSRAMDNYRRLSTLGANSFSEKNSLDGLIEIYKMAIEKGIEIFRDEMNIPPAEVTKYFRLHQYGIGEVEESGPDNQSDLEC